MCGETCLINKNNGNSYVGSYINLAYRMKNYINNTYLKSRQNINMTIVKDLLKYNQYNFKLINGGDICFLNLLFNKLLGYIKSF